MRFTVAGLLAGLLVGLLTTPATAQTPDADGDAAFERLATCARDQGRLLVLLLIDESGSLPRTDPEAQRVAAAQSAVRSLARLGDHDDVSVEIAVSGFSVGFNMENPWTTTDSSSVGSLLQSIESFRDRDSGLDTDFGAAFTGAEQELNRHAAETSETGVRPCKLLLLFTDGDYDIELRDSDARRAEGLEKTYAPGVRLDQPGNPERVEQLGRDYLCDGDGLVDQMRSEDIVLVTIALEQEISSEDRTFLRAVSTGASDATRCGEVQGEGLGAYIPATNLRDLLAGFNRAANLIRGATEGTDTGDLPVCPRERCAEGRREFELSPAYEEFHLLANSGAREVVVELTSPETNDVLVLTSGQNASTTLGSVPLEIVWLSPVDVAIDGSLPPDESAWVGTWTLTFVDPTGQNAGAIASAQLFLFGGLSPQLLEEPVLRMGQEGNIDVRIVDSVGTPRTPTDFVQEARVGVTVTDPVSGREQELEVGGPDGEGRYRATWPVPTDISAATVNVTATLDVVAATGVALQPRLQTYAIPVLPPATFPHVGPSTVHLSGVSGRSGEAVGTLTVTGGEESAGCVWFEGVSFQRVPRRAQDLTASFDPTAGSQVDCLTVGPGEVREVDVRVDVGRVASGAVEGRLEARLASDANPDVLSAELPFSFDMHRPVDQARRIGLFLAFLIPGLLLPFVVLWILNWWGARFEPVGRLRTASIPVHITSDGRLWRVRDGVDEPLRIDPSDFGNAPGPQHPAREVSTADLELSPKVPLIPFRAPYGVAEAPGRNACGSAGFTRDTPTAAKVPFNLARQWVFLLGSATASEDTDPDVHGHLRVFLPEGPMRHQVEPLVDELTRTVPAEAQRLAALVEEREPEPTESEVTPPTDGDGTEPGWGPPPPRGRSSGPPASTGVPSSPSPSSTAPAPPATDRPANTPQPKAPEPPPQEETGWRPPPR